MGNCVKLAFLNSIADQTGRRSARDATTGRPEERTAIRRIDTESVEAGEVIILKTRGTGDRRSLLRAKPRNSREGV